MTLGRIQINIKNAILNAAAHVKCTLNCKSIKSFILDCLSAFLRSKNALIVVEDLHSNTLETGDCYDPFHLFLMIFIGTIISNEKMIIRELSFRSSGFDRFDDLFDL